MTLKKTSRSVVVVPVCQLKRWAAMLDYMGDKELSICATAYSLSKEMRVAAQTPEEK